MEDALDKAVRVFSERGFHGTSIADLTTAMGLASGSVYKAFKDKRAVFLAALDRYRQVRDAALQEALRDAATGRERVRAALTFYARSSCGAEGKRGCLVIGGAAEMALSDAEVAARVAASFRKNEALMDGLLREGQADGSIAATLDVAGTARLMACLIQGMRIAGKSGRRWPDMAPVVAAAMAPLG